MSIRGDPRGSVTAEFAVVVPAVVLVALLTVALLLTSARQVRLEQAAAQGARLAARGEADARVGAVVDALIDGARVGIRSEGDLVCVEVSTTAALPGPPLALAATSCSLAGGL